MKKQKSLRKRWLINIVGVAFAIGLICVLAMTALFGFSFYTEAREDMEHQADSVLSLFSEQVYYTDMGYYDACVSYVHNYVGREDVQLQFVDAKGKLIASSGDSPEDPATEEIRAAMLHRDVRYYIGEDPAFGQRVIAVSAPMIYSNGEVIGVLRFVTSTEDLDGDIFSVAMWSLGVMLLVVVLVAVMSNFSILSVLKPVEQITEKAKRIAGGTYGIQINTKHNDEIGELANTINELSSQIARNEKTQTEFISSLSHELRTPLTAINGWSETLLSDDTLDPDTRRGVKIISGEAKRLTEMVVDLLDFTRIQDGRMTLNMEPADLRSEFEDTVFMYSGRLSQDGITLDYVENDDEVPEITCDAQRLRQVFLNILDNAAKHGGEGKRIEASMHCDGEQLQVCIRDYGPGIPEDEIPLVKRKFFKGSSKARGSGIGLAVCDEIVQMHGGELTLCNAEGGGTLVTVTIPAVQ